MKGDHRGRPWQALIDEPIVSPSVPVLTASLATAAATLCAKLTVLIDAVARTMTK